MTYDFQRQLPLQGGREGKLYLSSEEPALLWRVYVEGHQRQAAHAYTLIHGQHLRLNDLWVEEVLHLPARSRWMGLMGRQEAYPLREQGLGSLLLREIQQQVRQRGLGSISGELTPETEGKRADLERFYRRHGFILQNKTLLWIPE